MARRVLDRPEIVSHDVVTRALHRAGTDLDGAEVWSEPLEVLTRSLDREARLTMAARRAARDHLVDLLTDPGSGRRGVGPDEAPPTSIGPVVIITGPDPDAVTAGEAALGAAGRGRTLLDAAFVSMSFERRWQVPSYSEWLAEADVGTAYADVAQRSSITRRPDRLEVLGAVELGERLDEVDAAFPGAFLLDITRDLDAAIAATTEACVRARRAGSRHVDAAKVERYWRWRLGTRAERRAGGRPADLSVTYDELLAAPDSVAMAVSAAVGG